MGTDRLNLLKLSVIVGLGCKSSMCGWCVCLMDLQCVSVCLYCAYGFLGTECMQGLCGSCCDYVECDVQCFGQVHAVVYVVCTV